MSGKARFIYFDLEFDFRLGFGHLVRVETLGEVLNELLRGEFFTKKTGSSAGGFPCVGIVGIILSPRFRFLLRFV